MSTEPGGTPLVTPEDVAARLGIVKFDDDAATDQCEAYCTDVSELIRSARPDIDEWLDNGRIRAGTVLAVACQAVQRALFSAATGGIPIVGESHPEASTQYSQAAKAGLYLSADELADLTPSALDMSRARAFSIMPS